MKTANPPMSDLVLNNIGPACYKTEITFSSEELKKAEEKVIYKINSSQQFKGFRKGKAPEHLIRSKFSNKIKNDSSLKILENHLPEIEEQLQNQFQTQLHQIDSIKLSNEHSLELAFDCFPYAKLCKLTEVRLYDDEVTVSKEKVDNVIKQEQINISLKNKQPKETNDYEPGDLVVGFIEILVDDIPHKERKEISFILDKNQKDNDVNIYILKEKPPLKQEFIIKKEFKNEKGQDSHLTIIAVIESAYKLIQPPVDENFLKLIDGDFKNIKELEAEIKKRIIKMSKIQLIEEQYSYALQMCAEKSEFFVSDSYREKLLNNYLQKSSIDKTKMDEKILGQHREALEKQIHYQIITKKFQELVSAGKDRFDEKFVAWAEEFYSSSVSKHIKDIVEKYRQSQKISDEDQKNCDPLFDQYIKMLVLEYLKKNGAFVKGIQGSIETILEKRFKQKSASDGHEVSA